MPGTIVSEDIFVNTKIPIIRKDVMITAEHIRVLHEFGVKEVKVASKEKAVHKKTIDPIKSAEIPEEVQLEKENIFEQENIIEQYNEAVLSFKKEYIGWQAGIRPDIPKLRAFIIPLLEVFGNKSKMLTSLTDYSNPEDYQYHHSIAVGLLASSISKEMGFPVGQTLQIGLAGVLADCGMSKIDPLIMKKAGFLTKSEFSEVKKHTIYSYQMLQDTPFLRQEMKIAIFQHHERIDGSGYPRENKFEEISTASQIIAVADVFHAMTSERIFCEKKSLFEVIELIMVDEFGKFDINVVHALQKLVGNLSIGTNVQLTNGRKGEVIFVHRDTKLRPMVKMNEDDSILNLATSRHLAIDRIL